MMMLSPTVLVVDATLLHYISPTVLVDAAALLDNKRFILFHSFLPTSTNKDVGLRINHQSGHGSILSG
jgi:hypothetical protein